MSKSIQIKGKKKIKILQIHDSFKITLTKNLRNHLGDLEVGDYIAYKLLPNNRIELFIPKIEEHD